MRMLPASLKRRAHVPAALPGLQQADPSLTFLLTHAGGLVFELAAGAAAGRRVAGSDR